MAAPLNCLRCQVPIEFVGEEDFRVGGQTGFLGAFLGNLNQFSEATLALQMYRCPSCGKIEFFLPGR